MGLYSANRVQIDGYGKFWKVTLESISNVYQAEMKYWDWFSAHPGAAFTNKDKNSLLMYGIEVRSSVKCISKEFFESLESWGGSSWIIHEVPWWRVSSAFFDIPYPYSIVIISHFMRAYNKTVCVNGQIWSKIIFRCIANNVTAPATAVVGWKG